MNIMLHQDDLDCAVREENYEQAGRLHQEILALREQEDEMLAETNRVVVEKVVSDKPETICRYYYQLVFYGRHYIVTNGKVGRKNPIFLILYEGGVTLVGYVCTGLRCCHFCIYTNCNTNMVQFL